MIYFALGNRDMGLEHWLYTIPLRLRSLFRRKQLEQELEEELQFHLAQRIEQEVSRGTPPDEARFELCAQCTVWSSKERTATIPGGYGGSRI